MCTHLRLFPRLSLGICSVLLLAVVAAPSSSQETSTPLVKKGPAKKEAEEKLPPALTHYKGREIAQTMHYTGAPWLVRESREREEECTQLLKCLNVKKDQVLCDLGCGNGFYTLELAEKVGPKGKIYAVDIQPEMLQLLRARLKDTGRENVTPVLGSLIDPKLPDGQLDMVLLVDVYHEFSHPEHMLAAIRKSLKPTGRLVLVEFREEDPKVPIKPLHKMSKRQVQKELIPNGFKLVEQYDELPWQHVLFFQRDEEFDKKPREDETK